VLGTFVVWIPAAIFLALAGDWAKAAVLVGWGAVIVASVDNLLRPVLMGERLKLHTVPMLIAVIGGLNLFGPAGVVLGPVAVTTTLLLLDFWRERNDADRGQ
jgi:predicted PurR-regulated permease PerM